MTEPERHLDASTGPAAVWLAKLRRTARNLLVVQRLGWIVAAVLAIVLMAGAADYILRTPTPLRVILWVVGLGLLVLAAYRALWPALKFRPSLTEVALRVERSEAGRKAGLEGVLASGLEFSAENISPTARQLAEPVIEEATRRLGGLKGAGLVAPNRTARSLIWMIGAVAAVAVAGAFEPTLTAIGAQRILWPFGGAQWPRRTGVVDITDVKVHPLGSALALRAALTRSSAAIDQTRVSAMYRTIANGVESPARRVLLTSQGKAVRLRDQASAESASGTGYLFERLLEPSGLGGELGVSGKGKSRQASGDVVLEYWFETEDDQTTPARVLLVEPPEVKNAAAVVELPPYAAAVAERFPELAKANGKLELGPGNDERSAPAAILAGSVVTLQIELNKAVPGMPALVPDAKVWLARCLGPDALALWTGDESKADGPRADVRTDGAMWTVRWTLAEPVRFSIKPTDEHGIAGAEESTYRFDTLKDNPPTAVVTAPNEDKSVLATAVVEISGEGRDDVGLDWVAMERQLARKPKGSEGAPTAPVEDRVEVAKVPAAAASGEEEAADSRRIVVTHTLDLSGLDLTPGDEIWLTTAAADAYEINGARHDVARSGVRKLRIMSREDLIQQIWSELGSIRRTAVKIDEDQREIGKNTASKAGAEEARKAQRAQAGVTERLARQADAIEHTHERVQENGLSDQGLQDVLRQAKESLQQAGEQSTQATQSLNEAAKAESQESAAKDAGKKEREQAGESQEQVRKELSKLIDMLDQGEDTYASKRTLEQMIQEQKVLQDQTQAAGQKTTGKSAEQLSPQEKEELGKIAEEQEQLAQKLKEAVSKMQDREQKMQKSDPAGAQAMANAAQRAQKDQTAEKMQQAAKNAQQNQTNNAQQRQQQAMNSMQQMLQDLEKANQNRDEVLRRFLASLIDSIKGLIKQQEDQLAALDRGIEAKDLKGLDAGMARLHQNTLGVLDQAVDGPRDAQKIAEVVERAAEAQSAAVVGLRDDPVNQDEVKAQEQLSLDKLNEALEQAQKMDEQAEQRQQDQKREALKQKYVEALATQISIKEGTGGLVGAEQNRRNKAAARELGTTQTTLRETLNNIRKETAEISQAKMFDYAHTRLDDLTGKAAEALGNGDATDAVVREQAGAVRILQSLISALEKPKNDKPFREREQAGGGGGGQGQQPLVPPAAEIKLLRLMQQDAVDVTRAAAESGKADPAAVDEVAKMQRELAEQGADLLKRLSERGPRKAPEGDKPKDDKPADGGDKKPDGPGQDNPDPAKP